MMWIEILIICFVFFESVVISIYNILQKQSPEYTMWVVMGSKLLKILFTVGAIFLVPRLTEIPMKTFALVTVGVYFISILFETIFFLKKNKQNDNKK